MQIEITFAGNKKVNARIRNQIIETDQPVEAGGDGSAPAPYDLFLVSMGTCAGIFVREFCMQRNIESDNIKILQDVTRGAEKGTLEEVRFSVHVGPDFPEQYKKALVNVVNLCSVKKSILKPPRFDVIVVSGSE